jgi:hypothetical protein
VPVLVAVRVPTAGYGELHGRKGLKNNANKAGLATPACRFTQKKSPPGFRWGWGRKLSGPGYWFS